MISYGKSYKSYNERAFVSEVLSIKAFANLTAILTSLVRSRAFKSPTSYKSIYYIRLVRNSCFSLVDCICDLTDFLTTTRGFVRNSSKPSLYVLTATVPETLAEDDLLACVEKYSDELELKEVER